MSGKMPPDADTAPSTMLGMAVTVDGGAAAATRGKLGATGGAAAARSRALTVCAGASGSIGRGAAADADAFSAAAFSAAAFTANVELSETAASRPSPLQPVTSEAAAIQAKWPLSTVDAGEV